MFRQITTISRVTVPRQAAASRAFSVSLANRKSVVDTAKDVLDKANKKTGEFLAGTIDKTENAVPTTEDVKNAAETANKKTGEVLSEGIDKTEDAAHKTAGKAQGKVDELKAQKKVDANTQGYHNLQDKGAKVETEQNRPDDAV